MTISKHFIIEGNRRNGYLSMTLGIADIIIIVGIFFKKETW